METKEGLLHLGQVSLQDPPIFLMWLIFLYIT